MFEDVEIRLKNKNKIVFTRDSKCLQELINLIRLQKHKTLVLWAFTCVEEPLRQIESKYDSKVPRIAYECCKSWAQGDVKMAVAKQAILDCHQLCKQFKDEVSIALCHAIGQGLSTVHVETHAIGLPMYELTAIVLQNKENYQEKVINKIRYYIDTLYYFQNNIENDNYKWADFLKKENIPNKENELWENKKLKSKSY